MVGGDNKDEKPEESGCVTAFAIAVGIGAVGATAAAIKCQTR